MRRIGQSNLQVITGRGSEIWLKPRLRGTALRRMCASGGLTLVAMIWCIFGYYPMPWNRLALGLSHAVPPRTEIGL